MLKLNAIFHEMSFKGLPIFAQMVKSGFKDDLSEIFEKVGKNNPANLF